MKETTPNLPGLSPVSGKELHAWFDGGQLSRDGGVLLLREIERGLGLAEVLSSCLTDARDVSSVRHSYADMIRARLFAIEAGLVVMSATIGALISRMVVHHIIEVLV